MYLYKNGYVWLYFTFIWQRLDQWLWFPSLVLILLVRTCTNKTVKILIAFDINNILQLPCCWPHGRFLRAKPYGKKQKLLQSGWPAAAPLTCMYVCVCILNWPLSIGAFQDQCKQWQINIQINITRLRIPTGGRQTSWLFTSVAEKLNLGLPRTTSASGQNGIWTRDLRISNPTL